MPTETISAGGDNFDPIKAIREQKLIIKKVIKEAKVHKTPFRFR